MNQRVLNIKRHLKPEENVLLSIAPSPVIHLLLLPSIFAIYWFSYMPNFFILACFALIYGIINSMFGLTQVLSNKRVIQKMALIQMKPLEMPLKEIKKIEIKKGPIRSIFGIGKIVFTGWDRQEVSFEFVSEPELVQQRIEAILRNEGIA